MTESSIRRQLAAKGYRLQKTPARHHFRDLFGPGYMVIDERNVVVLGANQRCWDATLEQVADWLRA